MRIIVLFDLPTTSKKDRRAYQRFRQYLLSDGYSMLQFSIYIRLCNGQDAVDKHLNRLSANIPINGSIRSISITDKQFAKMKLWLGEKSQNEEKIKPEQLILL